MIDFLHKAYMETTYKVFCGDQNFNLKIDSYNTEFNKWCIEKDINSWAIITAFNPFSQEFTKNKNEELNYRLKELILKSGFSFNDAKGIPSDINWDAEESFFIHNISLKKAQELGVFFEQNAIVYALNNNSKKLIWLV